MRVKPYAIRFPSRNARHTALSVPGGCMSTSGYSCRYRSSLQTWSGGPGEPLAPASIAIRPAVSATAFPNHLQPAIVVAVSAFRPQARADAYAKPRYYLRIRSRRLGSTPI